MGKVWAHVLSSSGTVLGQGPVLGVSTFSYTRVLDGTGSFTMTVKLRPPVVSQYALLTPERVIEIFHEEADSSTRSLGQFIIRRIAGSTNAQGEQQIMLSGTDILGAFKNFTAKVNRVYELETTSAVLADLMSPLSGWTIRALPSANDATLEARIDGSPILKAISDIVKYKANHFRLGTGLTLEWGAMGDLAEPRLEGGDYLTTSEMGQNPEVIPVETIVETTTSEEIFNRLYPLGAGQGLAQLTLESATQTGEFAIKSEVINGVTVYYIEDESSVAQYGPIERTKAYSQVAPVANNSAAIALAATALYEIAAFDLRRSSTPYKAYSASIPIVTNTLKPGQKVSTKFRSPGEYVNVDDTLWVLSFTQTFSENGITGSAELANQDRVLDDVVEKIGSLVENASISSVKPSTFPSSIPLFGFDFMRSPVVGNPQYQKNARFEFDIEDYFTGIIACRVNIRTAPLFAPAAPTAGAAGTFNWGVTVDTTYPSSIHLWINGVDVTGDFGGPWNVHPTDAAFNMTFDITDYILGAPSGIFQKHVIELSSETPASNMRAINFPGFPAASALMTHGVAYFNLNILGIAQGILPG